MVGSEREMAVVWRVCSSSDEGDFYIGEGAAAMRTRGGKWRDVRRLAFTTPPMINGRLTGTTLALIHMGAEAMR